MRLSDMNWRSRGGSQCYSQIWRGWVNRKTQHDSKRQITAARNTREQKENRKSWEEHRRWPGGVRGGSPSHPDRDITNISFDRVNLKSCSFKYMYVSSGWEGSQQKCWYNKTISVLHTMPQISAKDVHNTTWIFTNSSRKEERWAALSLPSFWHKRLV